MEKKLKELLERLEGMEAKVEALESFIVSDQTPGKEMMEGLEKKFSDLKKQLEKTIENGSSEIINPSHSCLRSVG